MGAFRGLLSNNPNPPTPMLALPAPDTTSATA